MALWPVPGLNYRAIGIDCRLQLAEPVGRTADLVEQLSAAGIRNPDIRAAPGSTSSGRPRRVPPAVQGRATMPTHRRCSEVA